MLANQQHVPSKTTIDHEQAQQLEESRGNLLRLMSIVKHAADDHLALARKMQQEEDVVSRFARDVLCFLPVLVMVDDGEPPIIAQDEFEGATPMMCDTPVRSLPTSASASATPTPIASPLAKASPQERAVAGARTRIRHNMINCSVWPKSLRSPSTPGDMGPPVITPLRFQGQIAASGDLFDENYDGFSVQRLQMGSGMDSIRKRKKGVHWTKERGVDENLDIWELPGSPKATPTPTPMNAASPSLRRPFARTHRTLNLSFGAGPITPARD
ncbi:hypothetical protein C8F01DRAFT_1255648 [Mycena amicta]|nr:hypothetical protein C8F01DRAFT_1255648 [Mycena amicta]